jgi:lipopolysaccharide export system protein LptA
VALFEQQPQKPGGQPQPPLRATAGKAVYEGAGEWLHLTVNPRVVNGGLEMTADKVDVSQQSGDAFAHGDVKATWSGEAPASGTGRPVGTGSMTLGGKGPAHVIAAEAQVNRATGDATFRGHARLWQEANSVAGPVLVLNQHTQTLTAQSSNPAEPVRAVMLNTSSETAKQSGAQSNRPSVIRVRGGDLRYSDAERRAVMHGGVLGAVVAETGTATSSSDVVELQLLPAGTHESSGQAQVDRMTATGHVTLTSQGRRGSGEQMVYTGASGDYVLTGTATVSPRLSDPERGTVTGETLIFHSRDDSVSIEGGGRETRTETTAPDVHGK